MPEKSCFYEGWLRRRRYDTREFLRVPFSALYLDLAETAAVFGERILWSYEKAAPAWLRRADYLGDPNLTLDESVRRLVFTEIGRPMEGPVRVLSQLRTWGFLLGPADAFYCFDRTDTRLEAVVLDARAIHGAAPQRRVLDAARADYDGERYRWDEAGDGLACHASKPGDALLWHFEHTDRGTRAGDATVALEKRPLDAFATLKTLIARPFAAARLRLTL